MTDERSCDDRRLGSTLFTVDGPFAADGLAGLYVPVTALAAWLFLASVTLALDLRGTLRRAPA